MIARTRILQSVVARSRQSAARCGRDAFTLLELLVVVGIIAFLMSLTAVALGTALNQARVAATRATITKINGILQQRIEAFDRWYTKDDGRLYELKINYRARLLDEMIHLPSPPSGRETTVPPILNTLVRKRLFRDWFPQRFAELQAAVVIDGATLPNSVPPLDEARMLWDSDRLTQMMARAGQVNVNLANHASETESAEVLYYMLTQMPLPGSAVVDVGRFGSFEIGDTDGDGLMEFLDSWGRPLRFYRWPTQLFRPETLTSTELADLAFSTATTSYLFPSEPPPVTRRFAEVLANQLPPPIIGPNDQVPPVVELLDDPLARDPDDPFNRIRGMWSSDSVFRDWFATRFHMPGTFHRPLIVSAGSDGELGMQEPSEWAGVNPLVDTERRKLIPAVSNWGRWGGVKWVAQVSSSQMLDNITNLNISNALSRK